MNTFNPGDIVYSIHGEQMEYVAHTHDGHVTRALYERDESESTLGLPELHSQVFAEAPSIKFDADTKKAKDELEQAKNELRDIRQQTFAAKTERDQTLKALSSQRDLSIIVDWVEGRLTHLAAINPYSDGFQIKAIEEALTPRDESDARDGKVRLLAIYGGYSGPKATYKHRYDSLRWQMSAYSDGSGSSQTLCILGTSEDDVKERLQKWLDVELNKTGDYNMSTLIAYVGSALKIGLRVPPAWMDRWNEAKAIGDKNRLENAERHLKEARNAVARCETALKDIRDEQTAQVAA